MTSRDRKFVHVPVLAQKSHFANQPPGWGDSLFPDRVGNFEPTPIVDGNEAEIPYELCRHPRFDLGRVEPAKRLPGRMLHITNMFMPRPRSDRSSPVPRGSKTLAFISQLTPDDVVFSVECSVRAAKAAYDFLIIEIPPRTPHDKPRRVHFEALIKAFQ